MKMKMKEVNGTITLVVSGTRQQLIITEEHGCFVVEMVGVAHNVPAPAPAPAPAPVSAPTPIPVPTPEEERATKTAPSSNSDLFSKLVRLRKSIAVTSEVPPYLIFHDKTLHEMVDKMPANMHDMGNISGVGLAKLEKYGHVFLDVINGIAA